MDGVTSSLCLPQKVSPCSYVQMARTGGRLQTSCSVSYCQFETTDEATWFTPCGRLSEASRRRVVASLQYLTTTASSIDNCPARHRDVGDSTSAAREEHATFYTHFHAPSFSRAVFFTRCLFHAPSFSHARTASDTHHA